MIKILIADDHPIVRAGLSRIVSKESDITVAGEAQNAREVLELIHRHEFDVVVLDISMPEKTGLEILEQIRAERPALPVLILSMHPEEQYAIQAFKSGAAGYLTKTSVSEELVKAVRKVDSGGKYVSPHFAEKMVSVLEKGVKKLPHETLSSRELQVMRMIASGRPPKDIAKKLRLSVRTVNTYRERIMEKLNVKSNAEIVRYSLENKLLD